MAINWIASFWGDRPETRRGLLDPSEWNGALADDLAALRTKNCASRTNAASSYADPCGCLAGLRLERLCARWRASTSR